MFLIRHSKMRPLCTLLLATALSGCATHNSTLNRQLSNAPQDTQSSMSSALECMGERLSHTAYGRTYVFMVGNITDSTVAMNSMMANGLSSAGRQQMRHAISSQLNRVNGVVLDQLPTSSHQTTQNRGAPSNTQNKTTVNYRALGNHYGKFIKAARQEHQLNTTTNVTPVVISGSYARHDSSKTLQTGSGFSASHNSSDDNASNTNNLGFGASSAESGITLIVNIVDPRNNLIVKTRSFDLFYNSKSRSFTLGFSSNDTTYGFSNNRIRIEGAHAAQQTLIDTAATWVLSTLYPTKDQAQPCGV